MCAGLPSPSTARRPIEVLPRGDGAIRVAAPARFTGKLEFEVTAALGVARAAARVRLKSGPAVSLNVALGDAHLVADGRQSVEVRVETRDWHGTPAGAGALRWHATSGHVAGVRTLSEGAYVARFTPGRAREPHVETLSVTGDGAGGEPAALTAAATLAIEPPRVHAVLTARVGLFSNFGSSAGPAAALEVLTGIPGHSAWAVGVVASYLSNDLSAGSTNKSLATARLELDQFPILAVARYHLPLPLTANVTVGVGAGLSLARVDITPKPASRRRRFTPARVRRRWRGARTSRSRWRPASW